MAVKDVGSQVAIKEYASHQVAHMSTKSLPSSRGCFWPEHCQRSDCHDIDKFAAR